MRRISGGLALAAAAALGMAAAPAIPTSTTTERAIVRPMAPRITKRKVRRTEGSGGRPCYRPHRGEAEITRRRRQIADGRLTPANGLASA